MSFVLWILFICFTFLTLFYFREYFENKPFAANNDTIRKAVEFYCSNKVTAVLKYGKISTWNTTHVTNMAELFQNQTNFNEDISSWDVSNVQTMSKMFMNAKVFNQPLNSWNTSNVEDMSGLFQNANNFNQSLQGWNVSKVTNMSSLFSNANSFNSPLDDWDVRNVIDMSYMFYDTPFNQLLDSWDVSDVKNMSHMFAYSVYFNQELINWYVDNVCDVNSLFHEAGSFNQMQYEMRDPIMSTMIDGRKANRFKLFRTIHKTLIDVDKNKIPLQSTVTVCEKPRDVFATSLLNTPDKDNKNNILFSYALLSLLLAFISFIIYLLYFFIYNTFYRFIADNQTLRQAVELYCTNKDKAITKYGEITSWNTSNVTNMKELFQNKREFNEDISS